MTTRAHPSFAEAFRFWLKLGFISFGGPTGQIAVMHSELVDKRRWTQSLWDRRSAHGEVPWRGRSPIHARPLKPQWPRWILCTSLAVRNERG